MTRPARGWPTLLRAFVLEPVSKVRNCSGSQGGSYLQPLTSVLKHGVSGWRMTAHVKTAPELSRFCHAV